MWTVIRKCDDEDSICVQKVKASRRGWKTGTSRRTEKITSEQTEPKVTSSSVRDSAVKGDHIISISGVWVFQVISINALKETTGWKRML